MTDHGQWDECPAGLLQAMAGEMRARQFRARLRPVIAGAAILLIFGIVWAAQNQTGEAAKPLDCGETIPLLADYQSGALRPALTARVAEHLATCPSCRKHFEDQFPGEARSAADSDKVVVGLDRSGWLAAR